jgi:hypothetical protein
VYVAIIAIAAIGLIVVFRAVGLQVLRYRNEKSSGDGRAARARGVSMISFMTGVLLVIVGSLTGLGVIAISGLIVLIGGVSASIVLALWPKDSR